MKAAFRACSPVLFLVSIFLLSSCFRSAESTIQRHEDANSPAGKAGKAAHRVAVETEKAAAAAGKEINKAAHQANEGWREAAREDKAKGR